MINLYTWSTPNGRKVSIMLEELSLPYRVFPVDITSGDQHQPEFLTISPNNKIPVIVDEVAGQTIFESGAILLYLAEKTGRLLPAERRWAVIQWLMWQMGGQGPMLGQAHHFLHYYPGKSVYAEERYHQEAKRLYAVLNHQLNTNPYVAGPELSIADVAIWPWVSRFGFQRIELKDYPEVLNWYRKLAQRPAFQAGYRVPHADETIPLPSV